jgi:thiol-disulfide isomerase/thioredoxin
MTFVYDEKDTTNGIGIFEQTNNKLTGTILTPVGDYRYLNGSVTNGELSLHTFDGEHLYVFTATKNNDTTLVGEFRSGKSRLESWTATKNDTATLPDGDSLTLLKKGYSKIDFSFPDLEGKLVSPADDQFKNKVLVLQLFGSWCSNCMDETRFLSQWYRENQDKAVAILGLAYEQKADFEYGKSRVEKMKSRLQVPYDFVLAGTKDKEEASKTLPMLNQVIAFPTLIFVGKNGEVKRIHTGFNGPGTGKYYEEFQEEFNQTITELLSE